MLVCDEGEEGKRLVAYYTGEKIGAEALRAHLSPMLPEYMVPAAYMHVEFLPLTPNGKLDRRALPAPESGAYVTRGYEPPVGEIETRLARIWADLLKLEMVGRDDNFFELGGHSLLAVKMIERMRRERLTTDVRDSLHSPYASSVGRGSRNQRPRRYRNSPQSHPAGLPRHHARDAAAGETDAVRNRQRRCQRARRGSQRPGHLSPGAAAGRNSLPPPNEC